MGAGDYRIPATLEEPHKLTNELGEQEITWAPVMEVWISVVPLRAAEVFSARQAQLQATHHVKCRWFDGLKATMRFSWQEPDGSPRVLNINSVTDRDERHIEWVIECTETKGG